MTESRVGFLYNAAENLSLQCQTRLLKSYYLMRCKEVSKGSTLPEKYFSRKVRCSYCCLEWSSGSKVQIRTKKICKKQKKNIQSRNKRNNINKEIFTKELEQICSFCKNTTVVPLSRSNKNKTCVAKSVIKENITEIKTTSNKIKPQIKIEKEVKKETQINVYANAKDIFSLKNENNKLTNIMNKPPKIIKNSNKKKNKFAGLCEKAVLASAKLKDEQKINNRLKLFLKPSS
ncbi:uncharacterized protein LOC131845556 [Achroia grisella]|uniref:uncharacterized protein LOC131845556 n=1 Tax=Achroia grisella TaxID=688607 RepID=UPI0027D2B1C6|nr:uncharacterized protein LOC131845556 [Achroia grisella]